MQAPKIGGAPTNAPILYNGGPVMRNPTNYLIFWQPPNNPNTFPAGFQAGVENYFKNIAGTPFYDIVTQYNDTSGDPVPNSTSLGAAPFIDSTNLPASGNNGSQPSTACTAGVTCPLTDADIQNEVTAALAANPAVADARNQRRIFRLHAAQRRRVFQFEQLLRAPDRAGRDILRVPYFLQRQHDLCVSAVQFLGGRQLYYSERVPERTNG